MDLLEGGTVARSTAPGSSVRVASTRRSFPHDALVLCFTIANVALIVFSALVAYSLRHDSMVPPPAYLMPTLLGTLAYIGAARALGAHHVRHLHSGPQGIARLFGAWVIGWSVVLVACVISKTAEDYSRLWLMLWFCLGLLSLAGAHAVFCMRLVAGGRLTERVALIVSARRHVSLPPLLAPFSLHIVETFVVPAHSAGLEAAVTQVRSLCAEQALDRLLIAPSLGDDAQLDAFTEATRFLPVEVAILPPDLTLKRACALGDLPVVEVVASPPLSAGDRMLKRTFDVVVGSLLLVVLAPLMLLLALAILLDSGGPVLFPQLRGGMGSARFSMLKFRTMNMAACRAATVTPARRNDPRVTRVGHWLRRTSLDELPQLVNVLKGDMSLVGPRPHAIEHDAAFSSTVREYMARHRVKPGMTGLAQISGARGEVRTTESLRRRLDLDLWYIEHWSLWLDLLILMRTTFHLMGRSVY